jgi:hypothetical protein
MKIVFFKRPKPKQFNYRPRYWDSEAEAMEKRKRQLERYSNNDRTDEELKEDLKSRIDMQWRRRHAGSNTGRTNPWLRIFVYALIIFFGIYVIFFTGLINNLVSFFTR